MSEKNYKIGILYGTHPDTEMLAQKFAGNLINNLFKSIWKMIIRDVSNNLLKRRCDLKQAFFGKITNRITVTVKTSS